ncbi:MAG TPA: hypothetical protein VF789_02430 [Thermoanaerobaculia bacterium]
MAEPLPLEQPYVIEFQYTPALARRIHRESILDGSVGYLIGFGLTLLLCLAGLTSSDLRLLSSFGLGVLASFFFLWYASYRRAGRYAVAMGESVLRVTFSEEGCVLESPDWRSRLAWDSVKVLHRFAAIWILGPTHYPYPVFVPPAALPYPVRLFIERKVKEAGGRLR